MLRGCPVCRKYAYNQQAEPLIIRPASYHAWYRVGVDFFQCGGSSYLCVLDALSNFSDVEKLGDSIRTARTVIAKLSSIFPRHKILMESYRDNVLSFRAINIRFRIQA